MGLEGLYTALAEALDGDLSIERAGHATLLGAAPRADFISDPTMPHDTCTGDHAFLSLYVWTGGISTENYVYSGG